MKKVKQLATLLAMLAVVAVPVFSDTLVLKNGERVSGYYEGGSARVIKFRGNDGAVKDYDLLTVQQLQFGDEKKAAAPAPSSPFSTSSSANAANNSADPRLIPGNQRVTRPAAFSSPNCSCWTVN